MSRKERRPFLLVLVVSIAFGLWLSTADAVPLGDSSSVLPVGSAAQSEKQPAAGDPDGDGFSNKVERYVGTDPHDACPDNANDDAWPPDINRDTRVDVLDMVAYRPILGSAKGDANFNKRFDLNADRIVNIADLLMFKSLLGLSCA